MSRLPPLNALRAFEASARRGGFAAAAEELNVTPAAVGQQVRQLEALIGARLFERDGRRLALTERGAAALGPLQRGFELVGEASTVLREAEPTQTLTLAAPGDIVKAWLARDLARWEAMAELTVVTLPPGAEDGEAGGADLALLCTAQAPAGSVRLMGESFTPLAAPSFKPERADLAGLEHAVLIEDASAPMSWRRWADGRGAYGAQLRASIRVDDASTALDLAEAGLGVVLGRKPLALDAIREGRLKALFPDGDLNTDTDYRLLSPARRRPSRALDSLSDHLKACAAARQDRASDL